MGDHRGDQAVQQLDEQGKEEKENAGYSGDPSGGALADAATQPAAARATNVVAVGRFADAADADAASGCTIGGRGLMKSVLCAQTGGEGPPISWMPRR